MWDAALADLKANSESATQILRMNEERMKLRMDLPHMYEALINSSKRLQHELNTRVTEIEGKLNDLRIEEKKQKALHKLTMAKLSGTQKEMGSLEERLRQHHRHSEKFASYLEDFEESLMKQLENRASDMAIILQDAVRENTSQVEKRLFSSRKEIEKLKRNLRNIESLAIGDLIELPSGTDLLFRILNPELLSLSSGEHGAEILDEPALMKGMNVLSGRMQGEVYRDESIKINLSALDPPDVSGLTDKEGLVLLVDGLSASIARDATTLEAIEKREELEKQLGSLKKELKTKQFLNSEWQQYSNNIPEAKKWEDELSNLKEYQSGLESELNTVDASMIRLTECENQLNYDTDKVGKELCDLKERTAKIEVVPDEWGIGKDGITTEYDIFELFRIYDKMYLKQKHLSDRIADGLSRIETSTYGRYRASDEMETLKILQDDIDALVKKEEAVRNLWLGLAKDIAQAMKSLLKSLEILEKKVRSLNSELSTVSISDLQQLKLKITENSVWTGKIRAGINADEMPLFSDRDEVERSLRSLGDLLSSVGGGRIRLLDMFNLSFEILGANGKKRHFQKLANIESNGTTITIKVLVNLILLKDLMKGKKVQIPFYLDEASSLDRENLSSVVETAYSLGFSAILASPDAMDVAENIYFMKDTAGRVYLDPEKSRVHIPKHYTAIDAEEVIHEQG